MRSRRPKRGKNSESKKQRGPSRNELRGNIRRDSKKKRERGKKKRDRGRKKRESGLKKLELRRRLKNWRDKE